MPQKKEESEEEYIKKYAKTSNFGLWIDWEILHSKKIKSYDKLVFALIKLWSYKFKYCSASNQTIGDIFNESEQMTKRSIKKLKDLNFITAKYIYNGKKCIKRELRLSKEIKNKIK